MEAYRRAFIATGSFEPVKHVMVRASPTESRRIGGTGEILVLPTSS